MSTPLLSAFYFGSVEHYRLLARYPQVIIDIGEHYERQSYRTRTRIVGPNGVQDLTVQIARRSGEKMPMRTVGLSYIETWPQQQLHAIRSAYGNTPWFIHFIDEIGSVVMKKYDRLVDLDLATMRLGMKWLGLRTQVVVREDYVVPGSQYDVGHGTPANAESQVGRPTPEDAWIDLRTTFHPKRPLPAPIPAAPPYTQVFADRHGYQPRTSVIDLVMNLGPEARTYIHRP
jgi:hypothetical protein